jgi:hypothetical protein
MNSIYRLWPRKDFAKVFHAYVSGDPTVRVEGTPLPRPVPGNQLVTTLPNIERAALEASRTSEAGRRKASPSRRLMLLAAREIGKTPYAHLAAWTGRSLRTVKNAVASAPTAHEQEALKAVKLLLSDRRRFVPSPRLAGKVQF